MKKEAFQFKKLQKKSKINLDDTIAVAPLNENYYTYETVAKGSGSPSKMFVPSQTDHLSID